MLMEAHHQMSEMTHAARFPAAAVTAYGIPRRSHTTYAAGRYTDTMQGCLLLLLHKPHSWVLVLMHRQHTYR